MFKKFEEKENVTGLNQVKSSVLRGIRNTLLDQYPHIEPYLDEIVPKKGALKVVKCQEHIEVLAGTSGELLFFKQREGPFYPTLKLVHKYPFLAPAMQVDKGAIRFVLSGANIMCPGLTSPGGKMTKVDKDTVVILTAEGKEHAIAVGITKISTDEILQKNRGIAIDNIHFLNDGLWHMKTVK